MVSGSLAREHIRYRQCLNPNNAESGHSPRFTTSLVVRYLDTTVSERRAKSVIGDRLRAGAQ
jgi:hypothetical protein